MKCEIHINTWILKKRNWIEPLIIHFFCGIFYTKWLFSLSPGKCSYINCFEAPLFRECASVMRRCWTGAPPTCWRDGPSSHTACTSRTCGNLGSWQITTLIGRLVKISQLKQILRTERPESRRKTMYRNIVCDIWNVNWSLRLRNIKKCVNEYSMIF